MAKPAKPPEPVIDEAAELARQRRMLVRQQKILSSRENLMDFVKFTMPDPADPNDASKSVYENARHHDAVAAVLEEVERGNIQFLIVTFPPRHGKSELVSRRLPAWFLGRHPEQNIVVATYNDDFAMDFGAEVRRIMTAQPFKQIFPGVSLLRGGAAKDRLQTTAGGMATFVGVGGSLTGRGAHCFPAGTKVLTTAGEICIEQLKDTPASVKILSYDVESGTLHARHLQAFSARKATRLYRVTTASGRVVEATGDHPFATPEGYVQADQLAPGHRLLRVVRYADRAVGVRDQQERAAGADEVLLLQHVLGPRAKRGYVRASDVPAVRGACPAWGTARVEREHVLLRCVSEGRAEGRQGSATQRPPVDDVPRVRDGVSIRSRAAAVPGEDWREPAYVLWPSLRRQIARTADVGRDQSGLPARTDTASPAAAFGQSVPRGSAGDFVSGRGAVCTVFEREQPACASHQPQPIGQSVAELDRSLLGVPSGAARAREIVYAVEADEVLRVDEVSVADGGVEVYDIQVAGEHNFFANGVLTSNCLIIDDLIKDYEQARSKAFRDRAWEWFTKVAMTRRMGKKLVVITFTRWHTDDIIGRLTDPENENYNEKLAQKIKVVNFPAIADEDDVLGRQPGEALWPERYNLDFLEEQRGLDPLGFEALYQQRPSVADGILFRREHVQYYDTADINEADLRIYCASDHAVTTNQRSDSTVLLRVGVDRQNRIYLLDCWWRKARADEAVEAMLAMARAEPRPLIWWAEKGHISKSIGPFLRKRMAETQTFFNLVEVTPAGDKEQRAQSISARMAMSMVFFPKGKPWVEKAIDQLLAFPNGLHDDFCLHGDTSVTMGDRTVKPIREVRPGQFVLTPKGPRKVVAAAMTSPRAEVMRVRLSDYRVLVATAAHPVFVEGKGFVRVDALAYGDVLFDERQVKTCQRTRFWNTLEAGIVDTRRAFERTTETTFTLLSRAGDSCTGMSGKTLLGLSPTTARYTTETTTRSTTAPTTWSASLSLSIARITSRCGAELQSIWRCWIPSAPLQPLGTDPTQAATGTASTESGLGSSGSQPGPARRFVSAAARRLRLGTARESSATTPAVHVLGVEALTTPSAVYNLAVAGENVFFANGVLTHNCDALSYVGMGLQNQFPADRVREQPKAEKTYTFGWVKDQQRRDDRARQLFRVGGF